MDEIIIKASSSQGAAHSDIELKKEYLSKNPYSENHLIEIIRGDTSTIIFQNRNSIPLLIDRHRHNCFKTNRKIEREFIHSTNSGFKAGYCKF
jgi:hypothetical protein